MNANTPITLGLPPGWEGEALVILGRYERKFGYRLPGAELRSRALQKLAKAKVSSREHLGVLLSKIVHQVLVDYGEEQSRHYKLHVYDYAYDWPLQESGLSPQVQERMEELLDEESPLDEADKELLALMLEDPVQFMRDDGQPEQSALGRHLKVAHSTIGRRWAQILEKVALWKPSPPVLSI